MAISAGTAYIDVLPNMGKFAPAVAAQTSSASGALAKFGKTGALAIGAVGAASVLLGADFEKSMRNVNSIARLPEPAFDRLNERVLDLAGPTAQAPKTLAEGLYDLVSSGFDADDSMKILKSSAIAATAGLTTTEVATKGVAAVLNAYRLPASKAGEVSDQLFRTVDRGVITFDELASGIGDTLPFAAALGVGLEQVGAATATMTKQGLSGSETFTRIRNLLQTIIKPGAELTSTIKDLGYESGEALVRQKGLQGALEAIVGTTDGTKDAVAELFPNIRALGGALALTGDNTRAARKDLDGMKDSAGATQRAFEEQSKSLAVQWDKLKANLSVLAIKIGNVLIPAITDAMKWLNEDLGPALSKVGQIAQSVGQWIGNAFRNVASWISNAVSNVKNFITSWLPFKVIIAAVGAQIKLLTPIFNALKAAGRIAGSVIGGAFKIIGAAARFAWGVIKAFGNVIADVVSFATKLLRGDLKGAWDSLKGVVSGVAGVIKSVITGAMGVVRSAFQAAKGVAQSVFGAIGDVIHAVLGPIEAVIGAIQDLIGWIRDAIAGLGDLISKAADAVAGLKTASISAAEVANLRNGGKGPKKTSDKGAPLRPAAAIALAPAGTIGRGSAVAFEITNWRDGTGFMRELAGEEIGAYRHHDRQRRRMGAGA